MRPFRLLLILIIAAAGASAAEETDSPWEKLLLMQQRISRDLEYAKELRGLAMSQKGRLGEIMRKAEAGTKDPGMDPQAFEDVLKHAPQGLRNAEATLANTEEAIRELTVRLEQTDHALNNLPGSALEALDLGGGYATDRRVFANVQLLRHGHEETIALGQRRVLPGDTVVTDHFGRVSMKSSYAYDTLVTAGPDTRILLEADGTEESAWRLEQGMVHCRKHDESLGLQEARTAAPRQPPVIATADAVVLGDAESEFDVRINENGQTFVEVYRGKVEVKEPKKGTSYFVEPDHGSERLPRWWEQE